MAPLNFAPSMREAWQSLSSKMTSLRVTRAGSVPSAAAYPLLKQRAASVPFHFASAASKRKCGDCVAPHARFAVAEHDDDDVAAWPRTAANQAMSSCLRVTGFHTITVREPSENLVCVFELTGPAVGIAKNKLWKTNNRADCRIDVR